MFACKVKSCKRTFKYYKAFKKHVVRLHATYFKKLVKEKVPNLSIDEILKNDCEVIFEKEGDSAPQSEREVDKKPINCVF